VTDEEVGEWLHRENEKLGAALSHSPSCPESLKVCPGCGLMIGHSEVCLVCND
jgi:hypothetical protein